MKNTMRYFEFKLAVMVALWLAVSHEVSFGQANSAPAASTTNASAKADTSKLVLNLQQAIDYALKNQVAMKNAILNEDIAQERIGQIASAGLPQINGSVQFSAADPLQRMFFAPSNPLLASFLPPGLNPNEKVIAIPNFFQLANTGNASLTITQLIYSNTYLIGLKAANAYKDFAKKQSEQSRLQVIEEVSKAYFLVLITEERLNLYQKNVTRLDSLLKQTRLLQQNGLIEKTDLSRLQVAYNNLVTDQQNFINLQKLSKEALKFALGLDIQTDLTLTEKISDFSVEDPGEKGEKISSYSNRIEYNLLESAKHLQQLDIKNKQSSYLPSLAGFANLGEFSQSPKFDYFSSSNLWYNFGMFGLTLNIPIFDGFGTKHRIDEAKLNLQITTNNLSNVQKGIDLQVESAVTGLRNSLASLKSQSENIGLAKEVEHSSKLKFTQGLGSSLEVTTAETDLLQAQTNYYTALYSALIAKIDYQKAIGTLNSKK